MDSVAAANRLRRETIEVQAQLEAKRSEVRERMETVRQRELALAKQKELLQERLVKFYKLIQENDIKKSRAEKKAVVEQRAKEEKQRYIAELTQQISELEVDNKKLVDEVSLFFRYQRYLDAVLSFNDEYQHPSDIVQRHQTLDANNRELQARKRELEESVEAQKTQLQQLRKQKEDEILEQTNTLSQLQDQLEATHKHTLAAADRLDATAEARAMTLLTVGQVKLGLQNLYDVCVNMQQTYRQGRAHVRDDADSAISSQLAYVGECVGDFVWTLEKAQQSGLVAPPPKGR